MINLEYILGKFEETFKEGEEQKQEEENEYNQLIISELANAMTSFESRLNNNVIRCLYDKTNDPWIVLFEVKYHSKKIVEEITSRFAKEYGLSRHYMCIDSYDDIHSRVMMQKSILLESIRNSIAKQKKM